MMSATAYGLSMLRHAVKCVRSGGLPFFFSIFVAGLGVFSLAAFATLMFNFRGLASRVGESVAAVAFLDVPDASAAQEIYARIALHPDVQSAQLVSPQDALARAQKGLGDDGKALAGSTGVRMPWVVEVIPRSSGADRDALIKAIGHMPGVDEVMHPSGELGRIDALLQLMHGTGLFLAVLICLVVIVVVRNAVRLTVYQRKDELAILKLVGATDWFVRTPLLLSGLFQGAAGAGLGLAALWLAHTSLAALVNVALSGALGAFAFEMLPPLWWLALWVAGALLGLLGASFSVGKTVRL